MMTSSRKIYLSIASFSVLSILLIALVVYPFFIEIQKSSRQMEISRNRLNSLVTGQGQRQKVEELYKNYQSDLQNMDMLFVDPDVPLELISFLEQAASKAQVQLDISSLVQRKDKQDPWPTLFIQIAVTGFFPNFLRFLEEIENSSYLVEPLQLNIRGLTARDIANEEIPLADIFASMSMKIFSK